MEPASLTLVIDLVKLIGFPGVILWMWWQTHKTFRDNLQSMQEQHQKDFNFLNDQHKEDFEVLNKFARSIEYLSGEMTQLNSKVENNQFCPEVRKLTKPS